MRHLFRFYPAYLRLLVIVIAAGGLERLLRERPDSSSVRRGMIWAIAVIPPVLYGLVTFDRYGFMLLGASCLAASMALGSASPRRRRILAIAIVAMLATDLGRYFQDVSSRDAIFTAARWKVEYPLPLEIRRALSEPWELSPRLDDLDRVFSQMPVRNFLWPVNAYVPNPAVGRAKRLGGNASLFAPPFALHREPMWSADGMLEGPTDPLRYKWLHTGYNGWAISFEAPRDGWLSVSQIHEPGWQARLDDVPIDTVGVNLVRTAVRVPSGVHRLEMEFRPAVRPLYWPACWMLEAVLASLLWLAWKSRKGEPTPSHPI